MSRRSRDGLTLTEVLIVVGIVAVVVSLLLPATRRVREPAERARCSNNLKQLVLGLHMFESMGGSAAFPSTGHTDPPEGRSFPPGCVGLGATPDERLSWVVPLLPYLDEEALFRQLDVARGFAGNLPAAQTRIKTMLCPAAGEPADAVTHYVAMSGIGLAAAGQPAGAAGNGFMGWDRGTTMAMMQDGTSNTIALMETRTGLGPWSRGGGSTLRGFDPTDVPLHGDQRPFGGHANLILAAMADGSVRSIRSSVEPRKLAAAITIAGGEPFDLD
ncbi:MAG: DUF1559 domain-containing protein [Gemmataceae bacterium]